MKTILIDGRMLRTSTGRYIDKLLENLQQIDNKHKYIVLLKPADLDSWQPINPNFKKVASPYKKFSSREQAGLLRQIRSLKPDLVHFPMPHQPVLYRGKVVTTVHDLTPLRFPRKTGLVFGLKRRVYAQIVRVAVRKSAAVLTPTEFVKDDVARFARVNSRKITVTPESADKITEKARAVEELQDSKFIMYVGRSQPYKNVRRLIEAFALTKQSHPQLKLVLAGKKDVFYEAHEKFVKKHGLADVIFVGSVQDGQLRWLYEHAAAYVVPSLSEGFGLPGLEAMVHDAPVISSNATCLPEVYGDAAEYFDPLSVEDIAAKIAAVVGSEQKRQALIVRGHEQAKKYSWHRTAEQTLQVYKEVLAD